MPVSVNAAERLIHAAQDLSAQLDALSFAPPVSHVYNPLNYCWPVHRDYLRRYAVPPKKTLFLGMNPGPFGMAQTGVPFGEIRAVKEWLRLEGTVLQPSCEHPKRRVQGFNCSRSEVSGFRLWGLFAHRFGTADAFFLEHFVANYCPLLFLEESGCNRTPDKLPRQERAALEALCDRHLRCLIEVLQPAWIIGVGRFAEERAYHVADGLGIRIAGIPHPSPASPASNRDWAGSAARRLEELGVWQARSKAAKS